MSVQELQRHLHRLCGDSRITVLDTVPSTNSHLRALAEQGAAFGSVTALRQTAGRGRMGRQFYSPVRGLYWSILLRPPYTAEECLALTPIAAVAAAESLEAVYGVAPKIKWVNDLLLDDRKICGILTESAVCADSLRPRYVIVGVGINLAPPEGGFPEELREIAGTVLPCEQDYDIRRHAELLAVLQERFLYHYGHIQEKAYLEPYRSRLCMLGERILVLENDTLRPAVAMDVDEDLRLLVRYEDGSLQWRSSGEIRIRREEASALYKFGDL